LFAPPQRVEEERAPAPRRASATAVPALALPPKLLTAFRGGRCIPIVGSEIHAFSQVRSEVSAPTLRQVVMELAAAWKYPESEEVQFAERAGEGFISVIFPRVFQHFEQGKERAEIIAAIRKMCSARRSSPLLDQIATWNVPGIVYTHIDGLMMLALNNRADVRVMNAIEVDREAQNITSAVGRHVSATDREPLLLVNVRGSLNDPGSLVLTEADHENLEERLSVKGGEVGSLLRGDSLGRSLLFMGVHPRDPMVRRLCKSHLSDAKRVLRFFVTPRRCAVDESYWQELDVEWIYADPAAVIEALTNFRGGDDA
jgi:SIR2-like protein